MKDAGWNRKTHRKEKRERETGLVRSLKNEEERETGSIRWEEEKHSHRQEVKQEASGNLHIWDKKTQDAEKWWEDVYVIFV